MTYNPVNFQQCGSKRASAISTLVAISTALALAGQQFFCCDRGWGLMHGPHHNHHTSFLLTTLIPPSRRSNLLLVFSTFFIPFSFDCNKIVRSYPKGLSITNGKGSVITFRISVTPIDEDEEVLAIFSGKSCNFVSIGARLEDFRFLGTKSFGFAEILCFLEAAICLSFSIDLIACLFKMLTILFFFTPASSSSLS
jgi:hypothetical protein